MLNRGIGTGRASVLQLFPVFLGLGLSYIGFSTSIGKLSIGNCLVIFELGEIFGDL